jgi:hypothetical protein
VDSAIIGADLEIEQPRRDSEIEPYARRDTILPPPSPRCKFVLRQFVRQDDGTEVVHEFKVEGLVLDQETTGYTPDALERKLGGELIEVLANDRARREEHGE